MAEFSENMLKIDRSIKKTFIIISSVLTWGSTLPPDPVNDNDDDDDIGCDADDDGGWHKCTITIMKVNMMMMTSDNAVVSRVIRNLYLWMKTIGKEGRIKTTDTCIPPRRNYCSAEEL